MEVRRSLAFDLNSLSLPRLLQEEVEVDLSQIPMVMTESGDTMVRFSDLYDLSKHLTIPCSEALELLKGDHAVKGNVYAVVLETRFYDDKCYRQSVLESSHSTPMVIKGAGIDDWFDQTLQECIEEDLYMGSTERFDSLCELFGNFFGLAGDAAVEGKSIGAAVDNAKARFGNWIGDKVGAAVRKVGPKVANAGMGWAERKAESWLGEGNNAQQASDRIADFIGNIGEKGAKAAVDRAAQGVRKAAWPHIRNALAIGGGLAVAGIAKNQLDNLTNQEAIANAKPGMAARMMNSLKNVLAKLTGQQQAAAGNPQQQGLISRMIEKVKNAIRALGRKVGLVS